MNFEELWTLTAFLMPKMTSAKKIKRTGLLSGKFYTKYVKTKFLLNFSLKVNFISGITFLLCSLITSDYEHRIDIFRSCHIPWLFLNPNQVFFFQNSIPICRKCASKHDWRGAPIIKISAELLISTLDFKINYILRS